MSRFGNLFKKKEGGDTPSKPSFFSKLFDDKDKNEPEPAPPEFDNFDDFEPVKIQLSAKSTNYTDVITATGHNDQEGTFRWFRSSATTPIANIAVTLRGVYTPSVDDIDHNIHCQFVPERGFPSSMALWGPVQLDPEVSAQLDTTTARHKVQGEATSVVCRMSSLMSGNVADSGVDAGLTYMMSADTEKLAFTIIDGPTDLSNKPSNIIPFIGLDSVLCYVVDGDSAEATVVDKSLMVAYSFTFPSPRLRDITVLAVRSFASAHTTVSDSQSHTTQKEVGEESDASRVETLTQQHSKYKAELASLTGNVETLRMELSAEKAKVAMMKKDHAQTQSLLETTVQDKMRLAEEREVLQSSNATLKQRVGALESNETTMRASVSSLESVKMILEKKQTSLQADNKKLTDEKKKLADDQRKVCENNQRIVDDSKKHQDENKKLTSELKSVRDQLNNKTIEKETAMDNLSVAQKEIVRLTTSLADASDDLAEVRGEVRSLQEQVNHDRDTHAAVEQELEAAKEELAKVEEELREARDVKSNVSTTEDHDSALMEANTLNEQLQAQVKQLEEALSVEKASVITQTKAFEDGQVKRAEVDAEVARLTVELKASQDAVAQQQQQLQAAESKSTVAAAAPTPVPAPAQSQGGKKGKKGKNNKPEPAPVPVAEVKVDADVSTVDVEPEAVAVSSVSAEERDRELQDLKMQLSDAEARLNGLMLELEMSKSDTQSDVKAVQDQLSAAVQELTEERQTNERLKDALSRQETDVSGLREQVAALERLARETDKSHGDALKTIEKTHKDELKAKQKEVDGGSKCLEVSNKEVERLSKELDKYKAKAEELTQCKKQVKTLEDDVKTAKKEVEQLKKKQTKVEGELSAVTEEKVSLTTQVNSLKSDALEQENKIRMLSTEVSSTNSSLDSVKRDRDDKLASLSAAHKAELARLTDDHKDTLASLKKEMAELEEASVELTAVRAKMSVYQTDLASMRAQLNNTEDKLDEVNNEATLLRKQVDRLSVVEEEHKAALVQMQDTREELATTTARLNSVQDLLADTQTRLIAAEEECVAVHAQVRELEEALETMQMQVDQLSRRPSEEDFDKAVSERAFFKRKSESLSSTMEKLLRDNKVNVDKLQSDSVQISRHDLAGLPTTDEDNELALIKQQLRDSQLRTEEAQEGMKAYKKALEKELNKPKSHLESVMAVGNNAANAVAQKQLNDMKHLANTLMEDLHDKDLALEHMRKSNRILGMRIRELENKQSDLDMP